jgi:nucleoside-diphosphate-sugar epimerase
VKALITGGTGYLGLWACRVFREAGREVVCVDKGLFPSGVAALPDFAPGTVLVQRDIRADLSDLLDVDCVIHLAGLSNDPSAQYNPEANHEINTVATEKLGEAFLRSDARRFVYASTCAVYGESNDLRVTEDAPARPTSYYAASKLAAESALLALFAGRPDKELVILRKGTLMGWSPRMRFDLVVNTMVKSALTTGTIRVDAGGEARRPLLHVQDAAEAYLAAATAPAENVSGRTFNLTHDRDPEGAIAGYTIACLALWVKYLLVQKGHPCEVEGNWDTKECRSYDVSAVAFERATGFVALCGVTAAVDGILQAVKQAGGPRAYPWHAPETANIGWLKALDYGQGLTEGQGGVLRCG